MCGGAFEGLAVGAPEGGAGVEALLAGFDGGATTAARFASARVNPEIFFAVGAPGGATRSTVSDDFDRPKCWATSASKNLRAVETRQESSRCLGGDGAEGIHGTGETDFGFEDIANAGEQRLGE